MSIRCWKVAFVPWKLKRRTQELSVAHGGAKCCFQPGAGGKGHVSIAFHEIKGGNEAGSPQVLDEVIHSGMG